jgi:hypothetical protein
MEISRQLEEILLQINNELPEWDRVTHEEIASVGHQLNGMLTQATQQAAGQFQAAPPRTFKEKLLALWQAIKDRINAWLSPISPRWNRFLEAVKAKLRELQTRPGNEKLLAIGLMAVAVAVVAAVIKSIPLLIALLAALGFAHMLRLLERVTRIPQFI